MPVCKSPFIILLLLLTGCLDTQKDTLPPVSSMPEELQPFVAGLRDKNSDMRWQAARELGLRGTASSPAVPHLAAALKDENEKVRLFSALALAEIGPQARKALPDLQAALDASQDQDFALAAKRAIACIQGNH